MTRDEAREFAKVVRAYADGADVQWLNGCKWEDDQNGVFHPGFKWRVKPKEPRHLWTVVDGEGNSYASYFDESEANKALAGLERNGCLRPYTIIHSIEVLP